MGAAGHIREQSQLGGLASEFGDQIVDLGQHERRQDAWLWARQDAVHIVVITVPPVVVGDQAAGVD